MDELYKGPDRRRHKRRVLDTAIGRVGLDAFDEHVTTLTAEVAMLRHDVVQEREARRARQRWFALAMAVIAVAIVGLVYIVGQNRALVREQQRQSHLLIECTTPSNPKAAEPDDRVHECYDDGQRRTAEAIRQIIEAVKPSAGG